ncbi:hypothetical protein D3C84_818220 [compost metagenome]
MWSLAVYAVQPIYWIYGTGSNIDEIWTSKAEFYRNDRLIVSYPGGGGGPETSEKRIIQKNTTGVEEMVGRLMGLLYQIKPLLRWFHFTIVNAIASR